MIKVVSLFLLIFLISSIIHLYGSFLDNRSIRNPSKVFILLGLLGYYFFRSETVRIVVVLAIVFSWIGDVFLIMKGVKWFTIGGISFMISHFFFILAYLPQIDLNRVHSAVVIIASFIYLFLSYKEFKALKVYLPHGLLKPMVLYLLINATNNIFAWLQYLSLRTLPSLIILIGAVFFFISDASLFLVRFHKKNVVPRKHFFVMLTYIIAEFLIIEGLIMI